MKKLEYIYSPKILIRSSLEYRYFKTFEFVFITNRLKTKKSINENEMLEFQINLLECKKKLNKRVYTRDVVVELDIFINQRNAPSIQNIPKCYIDLLWRPLEKLKKKSLILRDDNQIKYLKVNFNKSKGQTSSINIKIFPYNRLIKDIELLIRLETSVFKYEFKNVEIDDDPRDEEQYVQNEILFDLVNHVKNEDNYKNSFGEEEYKYWELILKKRAQEIDLNNQRIKNNDILCLFRKSIKINSLDTKNDGIIEKLENIDNFTLELLGDFSVENLPIKSGEGDEFIKKLKFKIDEYFERRWFYFPLLNPIALSVFIVQPKCTTKDFDNLAKLILPLYLKKLNPPTSIKPFLQEIEKYKLNKHSEDQLFLDIKEEFPKNGILSYQVIQLPRTEDSPDTGFIKVNFHNAYHYRPFINFINSQLVKYQDKLDE